MRSQDEEFSQVFVPTSAGASKLLLAAGGGLTRNPPHQAANPRPFLKAAPLPMAAIVVVAIDHRSNSGDRDQAPAWFKFAGDAHNQLVRFLDLSVQVLHLPPQLC